MTPKYNAEIIFVYIIKDRLTFAEKSSIDQLIRSQLIGNLYHIDFNHDFANFGVNSVTIIILPYQKHRAINESAFQFVVHTYAEISYAVYYFVIDVNRQSEAKFYHIVVRVMVTIVP